MLIVRAWQDIEKCADSHCQWWCVLSLGLASCAASDKSGGHSPHATSVEHVSSKVVTYIKAGLAHDEGTVRKLCVPARAVAEQAMRDLHEMRALDTFEVSDVLADADAALAIGNELLADHGRSARMVFPLLRPQF